ncbi:Multidrug resistance protein MdtC [Halomonadaceae bacterium LMG 33818]|uniref:efflux RND transporter permease subunit n=1 Tax=Cernens ardua TaxID=3402176 RepID=UPI003EDBD73A
MKFLELFIRRPVATVLISASIFLLGCLGYALMPVAPLPQLTLPTIIVQASLSGANPDTMASTVAAPLERAMGQIGGISQITSSSQVGYTQVIVQFDLNRNINGAARDVQAAIESTRSMLPSGMTQMPTYFKANPSQAPILVLALTSHNHTSTELYNIASSRLQQSISQVSGVGQVQVAGSSLPAIRVELDPNRLSHEGISLNSIATAIRETTGVAPVGGLEGKSTHWIIENNAQQSVAADYRPLVIGYHQGHSVHLGDVANVTDSVEDIYNSGEYNGQPTVMLIISQSADANILQTVNAIKARLPELRSQLPAGVSLNLSLDRSTTIQAFLQSTELTLYIAVLLVIVVVLLFLRNLRAMLIPAVALPISLMGSCAVMYLMGYSLDNLSLMALIVATGFVVDDAIVVLENITRHIEEGMNPIAAAIKGTREVGFTVVAMTASLIAVFLPILLMGSIIGRLFREFAMTLSISLVMSLFVSLTLTPMLCAYLLKLSPQVHTSSQSTFKAILQRLSDRAERGLNALTQGYARSLTWAIRLKPLVLLLFIGSIVLNGYLFTVVQKGFFPDQDTGIVFGMATADQTTSYQAMLPIVHRMSSIIRKDPDVNNLMMFVGDNFGSVNEAQFIIDLKPLNQRSDSATDVANRLMAKTANIPGAQLFVHSAGDLQSGGGGSSGGAYQYSLESGDLTALKQWAPKVAQAMKHLPQLTGVDASSQNAGQEIMLEIDRQAAARYGINAQTIDTLLGNAFAQSQIATLYYPLNQYYVVMDVKAAYRQSPNILNKLYIVNTQGKAIPLSLFTRFRPANAPVEVDHQDQSAVSNISFNLAHGYSLQQAQQAIQQAMVQVGVPDSIHGVYPGEGQEMIEFAESIPWLLLAALVTMYIVLGMLYENLIHPITIMSTIPPAGLGALLLMIMTKTQLTVIAMIGILLLIGIVKKNAIMVVDFAISHERETGDTPEASVLEACKLRFRPIIMTSLAAFLGAFPMVLETRGDAGLRHPLGIAICGGLVVSQLFTLYTTPVIYVYLDKVGKFISRLWFKYILRFIQPSSAR